MFSDYAAVGITIVFTLGFVAVAIITAWLIRPKRPSNLKLSTYECGEKPRGTGWVQFNVRFYIIALAFVVFDVEAIFLFAWAIIFKNLGLFGLIEMTVFIFILFFGLIWAWRKGALKWV
jgi:NADH-quinone oxidoreductase subunit A